MLSFESRNSGKSTEDFLKSVLDGNIKFILDAYGQKGVAALAAATPVDTSLTADCWYYEVVNTKGTYSIIWGNTNLVNGTPVAILLQFGHGTGTGGYVEGRDYINPALQPIFDEIAAEAWKVVTKA